MVVENKPLRRINFSSRSQGAIQKSKSDRKKIISEKRQAAHAKREAIKTNLEAKNKKRDELLKLAQDANPEDEDKLKNDIAQLEKDIQSEQMEIDEADKEIDEADKADKDIDIEMLDEKPDDDDGEPGDAGPSDSNGNPLQTTESNNLENKFQTGNRQNQHQQGDANVADALAEAFQKGLVLDDTVCKYKQADTTLRQTQAILGYKQGTGNGRVAIVAETDVPGHQIYRIRRDVIVSSDKVDIIQTRRAGTGVLGKGSRGNTKWTSDDIEDLVGIAIEVPPGYEGNPENLVLPIRLSEAQKEEIKAKGERLPKQADVQLIIQWKLPKSVKGISENYFYSFESRAGCHSIYGTAKKANQVLYDLAKTAEQKYRDNGGLYSVEEALPELDALAWTPIGSRQASEEPGSGKNDKEKEEETKKQEEKEKQDEENKRREEEKKKQEEKKKNYELYFRSKEGIDLNAEFTVEQKTKFEDEYNKLPAST
ncbi:hypothetical protein V496_03322 [Pseudogymnoascus sp. VKM F-4515 (FW-2607)]|nr:hypothetical protein V496_03322 [Pseudogymnoascus sp. VKM F-4515 (FW-2607)]